MGAAALGDALEVTFAIVARCLERWAVEDLGEEIRRRWDHGVAHIVEVNEALGARGLAQVDVWG